MDSSGTTQGLSTGADRSAKLFMFDMQAQGSAAQPATACKSLYGKKKDGLPTETGALYYYYSYERSLVGLGEVNIPATDCQKSLPRRCFARFGIASVGAIHQWLRGALQMPRGRWVGLRSPLQHGRAAAATTAWHDAGCMKRVVQAPNLMIATLWADMLQRDGISATVQRAFACGIAGEIPPDQALPEIWVDDDAHHARALRMVDELQNPPVWRWVCQACTEIVEGPSQQCWNCGALHAGSG